MSKKWEYVVIEAAGGDEPRQISRFRDMGAAAKFIKKWYDEDEIEELDVMIGVDRGDGEISYEY